MKTFAEYEEAIGPRDLGTGATDAEKLLHLVIGLSEEQGELAGKIKKWHRDGWSQERLQKEVLKEAGDTLWYLTRLCNFVGVRMEDVAADNYAKLTDREERGVLQGEGDNR